MDVGIWFRQLVWKWIWCLDGGVEFKYIDWMEFWGFGYLDFDLGMFDDWNWFRHDLYMV